MIKRVMGKEITEVDKNGVMELSGGKPIHIDVGTGDGKFAYELAKDNPDIFVVALDADKQQMEKVSLKASKKPAKGGLPNILFIWSGVEQLPDELNGMADHIHVNFPWGSLLQSMVGENSIGFQKLTALGKKGAILEAYLTYHDDFEPQTISEKKLPTLESYLSSGMLVKEWEKEGVTEVDWNLVREDELNELSSSWLKKITSQRDRSISHIKGNIL